MNRNVIIIGAGGHGQVIGDIVCASGDNLLGFLDDNKDCLGKIKDYVNFPDAEFIIGIGNNNIRKELSKYNCKWYTAIHPSAIISPSVKIGEGSVVMPNAVINANAVIGKHCIINTGAIVEHDNILEDFVHISPGAKLGGTVHIGEGTWIGIGASVKNNIEICSDTIIGAGALVVKNIKNQGTYIGVPVSL